MSSPPDVPDDAEPTDARLLGLPEVTATSRAAALDPVERLATEFVDALRRGERPTIEQYVARYPALADQIRELFPLIAALEDWKADRELSTAREALPEQFELQRLGNYRIVRELGRGGMGVVFEAEQEPLGRRVAVKLLPWRFSEGSRWRDRFRQEARTAAQLNHPQIVPVFSYGEHEGRAYYVMQLVEGIGFHRAIERLRQGTDTVTSTDIWYDFNKGRPASPTESTAGPPPQRVLLRRRGWPQIARLALQVTDALRYAHAQGTLHRDIKPANVLLDIRGSVTVADFGLALAATDDTPDLRRSIAGTLRYMAPEQFDGHFDERTDLYSLGASLYEICVLQPAFESSDKTDLVRRISQSGAIAPRKIDPDLPRPLEAIILRAMERDPDRRYQSAVELMADLRQFLRGPRWPFRFWKRRG